MFIHDKVKPWICTECAALYAHKKENCSGQTTELETRICPDKLIIFMQAVCQKN